MVEENFSKFLAKDVTEFWLKEGNIRINGYTRVPRGKLSELPTDFNREDLFTARERLIEGCHVIRSEHGQEIFDMCTRLNLEDEQLHSNFFTLLSNIWATPENWGRLVSLFVATSAVAERLYRENKGDRLESIIYWFADFLEEKVAPWIRQRGGYGGLLYSGNREDCKSAAIDRTAATAGLVTMALGFGAAVVVGAIMGR